MADVNVGSLVVDMRADVARLQRDMDSAKNAVGSAASRMQSAMDVASTGIQGALAAITVGTLIQQLRTSIDYMDEMGKAAQRVGMSTEGISQLAYAGKLADVDMAQLSTSIKKLSVNLQTADEDGKGAGAALKALGIDAQKLGDTGSIIDAVADAFGGMEDGATKTALAVAIFGKSGADMIPLLNQGSDALRQARAEADAFGLTVSKDAAKAAEEFNDNLTRLGQSAKGFGLSLANAVLPALNDIVGAMVEARKAGLGMLHMLDAAATTEGGRVGRVARYQEELAGLQRKRQQALSENSATVVIDRDIAEAEKKIGLFQKLAIRDSANRASSVDDDEAANMARQDRARQARTAAITSAYRSSIGAGAAGGAAKKPKAPDDSDAQRKATEAQSMASLKAWAASEKDVFDARSAMLKSVFDAGLIDEETYYDRLDGARQENLANQKKAIAEEIAALEASKAKAPKQSERIQVETKLAEARARQAKLESEASRAATADWLAQEKSRADAMQRETQARQDLLKPIYDQTDALKDEVETYGWAQSAIQRTIADRLDEKAVLLSMGDADDAKIERLKAEAKARRELAAAMGAKESLEANRRQADETARLWEDAYKRTGDALAESIMRGGKSAGEYLRDYFKSLVLTPIIQASAQTLVGAGAQAIGMGGSIASMGGLGSAGLTLAGMGGSLGGLGAGISYGSAAGAGATYGALPALAAEQGIMTAGGAALGAAAPWLLGATAIYKLLGSFGGDNGQKSLAAYGPDAASLPYYAGSGYIRSEQADKSIYTTVKSVEDSYRSLVAQLGGNAGALSLSAAVTSDPSGGAGDQASVRAYLDGKLIASLSGEVGHGEGSAKLADYMDRAIVSALRETDLGDSVDALLDAMDPATATATQLAQAMATATESMARMRDGAKAIDDAISAISMGSLSSLSGVEKADAASMAFSRELIEAATAGTADEIAQAIQAGNTYLSQSQDAYASGAQYQDSLRTVTTALEQLRALVASGTTGATGQQGLIDALNRMGINIVQAVSTSAAETTRQVALMTGR